jgi:hypothetical protein
MNSSNPSSQDVSSPQTSWFFAGDLLVILFMGLLAFLYWQLVDNAQVGFTHDDGVYLEVARGLALAKGFKLMHVVGQPSQVKYPIMYPLLMVPIWLLKPQFPQNLPWFNALSVFFSVGAAGLIHAFLTRCYRFPAWLSLLILTMVFGNFFTMYFCSLLMTEAPFLFFSFLTLFYLHRQCQRSGPWPLSRVLLAGLLSVITFHVRVPAISLMAATGLWLLLNRQFKNTIIYGGISLLLGVLPWLIWTKTQTPPLTDINYPLVNAYSNYGLEFLVNMRSAKNYFVGVQNAFITLLNKFLSDMMPLLPDFLSINHKWKPWQGPEKILYLSVLYTMMGLYILQVIHALKLSTLGKRFHGRAFSIPALYLIFYLTLITLWNYEDQTTRFVIVVTPLLWLYFFKPFLPVSRVSATLPALTLSNVAFSESGSLSAVSSSTKSGYPKLKAIALGVIALFAVVTSLYPCKSSFDQIHLYRSRHYVARGNGRQDLWGEYQDSFRWVKTNVPLTTPMGMACDVVYGLYTGRPTFYTFWASLKVKNGHYANDSIPVLMRSLDHEKVGYLIAEPHMQARVIRGPMNLVIKQLLKAYPKRFQLVYTTPKHLIRIFKILPG